MMDTEKIPMRLGSVDCLRGLAILAVMYNHSSIFVNVVLPHIFNFAVNVGLVSFFFLSGYLFKIDSKKTLLGRLTRRLRDQLVPSIVLGTIFVVVYHKAWSTFLFSVLKYGFWFVPVLVETMLLSYAVVYPLRRFNIQRKARAVVLAATVGVCYLMYIGYIKVSVKFGGVASDMCMLLSVRSVLKYLPFYIFGMLCGDNREKFDCLTGNVFFLALTGLVGFPALMHGFSFSLYDWPIAVICMSSIVVFLLGVMNRMPAVFSEHTCLGRTLITFGRYSLIIYLVHFFIVENFRYIGALLPCEWLANHRIVCETIFIAMSVALAWASIGVARLLAFVPPLYRLLLGRPLK